MNAPYDLSARKRPVNLTLNEDLVAQTKVFTDNLSAVVETLLSEFLANEKEKLKSTERLAEEAAALWNRFNDRAGSFADEHSTL